MKEDGKIQMVNNKEEIVWVEIWKPTMELRWRELKEWDEGKYLSGDGSKVLEQKFVSQNGKVEWKEIPTV